MTSPIATWHPKAHFTSRIWNVRNSDLRFNSVPLKELREAAGHLTEVLGRQQLGPFSKWPSMQDSLSKAEENALKLFGINSSFITVKRRSEAGTPRLIEQDCKEWLKGKLWISPGIPLHDEMLDRFFECFKEVETDNWQILCFPSELEVPDPSVDPLKKKSIVTRQKKQVKSKAVIKLAKPLEPSKKKKPAKGAMPDDDQSIWLRTEPYLDVGNALILNTAFGTTREKLLPKPQVPKAPRRKNVLDHTKIHELVRLTLDKNLTCDSIAKQIRISRASVGQYKQRFKKANLTWNQALQMTGQQILAMVLPGYAKASEYKSIDFQFVRERVRKGEKLNDLYMQYAEYNSSFRFYSCSQFNKLCHQKISNLKLILNVKSAVNQAVRQAVTSAK